MPSIATIVGFVQREGEPVVLRRAGQPDLPLVAFVRGYRADEIVGAIQQGDRRAIFSNAEIAAANWPGPPRRGDLLLIGGRPTAIQSCETRNFREQIAMHIALVRG